jgi:hypothetical protein
MAPVIDQEPLGAIIKLDVLGNVWQKKKIAQVFVHHMLRPTGALRLWRGLKMGGFG